MSNILHSLWSTMTIGGGKKTKSEIIYLQSNWNFDVVNIFNWYSIIHESGINSFDIISTLEGMKWKEWNSKKL